MEEKEKAILRFGEWEHYAIEDEQIIILALKEAGLSTKSNLFTRAANG